MVTPARNLKKALSTLTSANRQLDNAKKAVADAMGVINQLVAQASAIGTAGAKPAPTMTAPRTARSSKSAAPTDATPATKSTKTVKASTKTAKTSKVKHAKPVKSTAEKPALKKKIRK